MRCERLTLTATDDPGRAAAALRALIPAPDSVRGAVSEIIDTVRARGDEALLEYTRRFDTAHGEPRAIRVYREELQAASAALDGAVRHGIERAIENLEAVMTGSGPGPDRRVELSASTVILRQVPIARAAIYVPGGRAPYPSTVVMGVVPARLAGVEHVAVCAPPGRDGDIDPVILAACEMTGATTVYRVGGAHAIAALAYGTESVAPVDLIVGPGNLYVQEAKRQVFGQVGIDGFAGPSDLLAIVTAGADYDQLATDLLAQAEHGPGTLVVGASDASDVIELLGERLAGGAETGAVAALVQTTTTEQALAFAECFAPEHLQLAGVGAEALAGRVTNAGCLFVGSNAGTAFGDYIAGSNHILPTDGAGRFASGLGPEHFLRRFCEVHVRDPTELARSAVPLARAEGFEQHAHSMEARIRENGPV